LESNLLGPAGRVRPRFEGGIVALLEPEIVDNIGADLVESIITSARVLIRHVVAVGGRTVSLTTKSRLTWKESHESLCP